MKLVPILSLITAACFGGVAYMSAMASDIEIALLFAFLTGWSLRSALCELKHPEGK